MKKLIQFLLIILMINSKLTSGQTPVSTRQCKVLQATALNNGESFACSGYFEFSEDQIFFIQKNGSVKYDFKIISSTTGRNGQSTDYDILFRGASGSIRVTNEINISTLIIDLSKNGERILPYKFFIQSLN